MKRIFLISCIIFFFQHSNAQIGISISFQTFYNDLSPYGSWIEYPGEGYVWAPYAGADFRPYGSRGHWVYTIDGWAWVSDYPWGWAPFHYGRWIYDPYRGWLWVPGYDWAPAWVTWGYYDGCYGWAPLGVDFSADLVGYRPPVTWWTFVGASYIGSPYWQSHVYGGWRARPHVTMIRNERIINRNIRVINNIYAPGNSSAYHRAWSRGPRPNEIEHFTHSPIRPVGIASATRPGADRLHNNSLVMYRPVVNRASTHFAKPARVQNFSRFSTANSPSSGRNANVMSRPMSNQTRKDFYSPYAQQRREAVPRQYGYQRQPLRVPYGSQNISLNRPAHQNGGRQFEQRSNPGMYRPNYMAQHDRAPYFQRNNQTRMMEPPFVQKMPVQNSRSFNQPQRMQPVQHNAPAFEERRHFGGR